MGKDTPGSLRGARDGCIYYRPGPEADEHRLQDHPWLMAKLVLVCADYFRRERLRHISVDELAKELRRLRPALQQAGVAHLWLFGSFVRGRYRLDSDLDVALRFDQRPENWCSALYDLKELLEAELDLPDVDVVDADSFRPGMGKLIRGFWVEVF
jgi:hypothetical protein